jgi:hypothetical protein
VWSATQCPERALGQAFVPLVEAAAVVAAGDLDEAVAVSDSPDSVAGIRFLQEPIPVLPDDLVLLP